MSIDPPGIWTETLHSQLGIRARTNDESQLGIRPLFSITWSVKGHATISDVTFNAIARQSINVH